MAMSDYKKIPVKPDTKRRLYQLKRHNETWDDLVARLVGEVGGDE
jgi:hypothetical protein